MSSSFFILPTATATALLLLFLSPFPTTTAANPIDTNGDALLTSSTYYILPVKQGFGGGLTLNSKNSSELCPLYVVQEDNELSLGYPVRFYPINSKQGFVSLSSNLNIDFGLYNICVQSTVWGLMPPDEASGRRYVAAGGVIWDPSVLSDWFKIEKAGTGEYDYKITYCPTELDGGSEVVCGEVGVFVEEERRLLGISEEPLIVRFTKAQDENVVAAN